MPEHSGSRGGRLPVVVALAASAISLGVPSAGVAGMRADPVLAVSYIGSTSLQVRGPDGTIIRSGGTLPAGSYQVQVDDPDFSSPRFQISGPGVSVSDDLNSTGMGIDRPAFLGPYTFQANASYRIQDANIGAGSAVTFTTTAGGSTSGGSSSGGSSSGGSSSGGTSGGGTSTTSSGTTKLVGTIKASVSVAGKPALTFAARSVKTLKAGKYTVAIADHSKKAGLIVWKLGSHAMTLSTAAATGSSSRTVTLVAGKWFFEGSISGPRTYFTVTS
jgi:hypothetical protein